MVGFAGLTLPTFGGLSGMEVEAIAALLEKGGLPGLLIVGLYLIYRFAPERKVQEPAQQLVEALNTLTKKVDALGDELGDLKDQTIDRLARVETEVKNIKERK